MSGSYMQGLHATNPYENFPVESYKLDLQGWGSDSPIFETLISQEKPQRSIEVGSWKGASAVHMANLMRKHGIAGEIVCVDTWLGGPELWLSQTDPTLKLPKLHGRPAIYEQFLANVIHSGHAKTIVPFPADSITGSKVMAAKRMIADAIYIDAGHEYEHVTADLKAWWPVLKPGGMMFGDDYHLQWIGVVRAVHDFAATAGLQVHTNFPHKWLVQKGDR
jgi:hypothetical protein